MNVYSVSQITSFLREMLDSHPHLSDVWISGEISNVSRSGSGTMYFTLRDANSALRCVSFRRGYGAQTNRLLQDGQQVVAHGRISLYEARGELQFYVDFVQPEGVGALQAEFERLKAKLEGEGLFDETRKRPLPRFPQRIGVATSASGAIFHDICHVLERRWPIAEVVLAPTPVQGPDAPPGIVDALTALNRRGDLDVIIVGRGGGAAEELAAFNDEAVARAIFGSRVPVVSAVGHETDYTIADLVADRRAPTPSAAAEIVAPDRREVGMRIDALAATALAALMRTVQTRRAALVQATGRLDRQAPDFPEQRRRVDGLATRSTAALDRCLREARQAVAGCGWRLRSLDPLATLARGFAIVQRDGRALVSARDVRPGDALDIRLRDGRFAATAGRVERRRVRRAARDGQQPLFEMPPTERLPL